MGNFEMTKQRASTEYFYFYFLKRRHSRSFLILRTLPAAKANMAQWNLPVRPYLPRLLPKTQETNAAIVLPEQ